MTRFTLRRCPSGAARGASPSTGRARDSFVPSGAARNHSGWYPASCWYITSSRCAVLMWHGSTVCCSEFSTQTRSTFWPTDLGGMQVRSRLASVSVSSRLRHGHLVVSRGRSRIHLEPAAEVIQRDRRHRSLVLGAPLIAARPRVDALGRHQLDGRCHLGSCHGYDMGERDLEQSAWRREGGWVRRCERG